MASFLKIVALTLLITLHAGVALAQGLVPNARQTFYDSNGAPLVGGKVYFYTPATTTPKLTYSDSGLTTPNANPVILDSLGSASIYGNGQYRQQLYDALDNLLWDALTQAPGFMVGTNQIIPSVANNAALLTFNHLNSPYVTRQGVTTAGDAPPLQFNWTVSACAAAADIGFCNAASGGGSWRAQMNPTGADLVQFGVIAGVDDTAALQNADRAMGSADWPTAIAKTIRLPAGNTALYNPGVTNIVTVQGTGDFGGSNIVPASTASNTGSLLNYVGVGPLTIDNIAFVCSTYAATGVFSAPGNCGDRQLYVGSATSGIQTNQITKITGRRLSFTGGNASVRIQNTQDIDLQVDEINAPYDHGVIVSAQQSGSGVLVARVNIHIKRCTGAGQYCVSTPVSTSGLPVNYAPRQIKVQIDDCVGAGFIAQKACADFVTETGEELTFDITGSNSYFGVETKVIKANAAVPGNTIPNAYRAQHGNVTLYQNVDFGPCLNIPSEHTQPLSSAFFRTNHTFEVTCMFNAAVSWLANTRMSAGQVFRTPSGNKTYIVVKSGTAGASEPTSTSVNTGIADGTSIVQYLQTFVPTSLTTTGVILEAMSYVDITLHAHQIGIGYLISPRGSSDNVLRYATLRFSGEVNKYCLTDNSAAAVFGTAVVADHVTLSNFACTVFGTDSPISLGNSVVSHSMQWSNMKIDGGTFEATDPTVAGALRINYGGSSSLVEGSIVGARFIGGTSAFNIAAPTTLNVFGGSLENTAGAGTTLGLINSATADANGTINLFGVGAINSDSTTGTFTVTAGSLAVKGNAITPPHAGDPTPKACSASIDSVYSTLSAEYWACTAANTWTKKF